MHTKIFQLGLLSLSLITLILPQSSSATDGIIILDPAATANLRLKTVVIDQQTFETTVFAVGRIEEIPVHHSVLSSRVAGRISNLRIFEGDSVQTGDVIATVETRQLGTPPPTIELLAPQSGLVINSHLRLGQPVQPEVELMHISDRSQMWAVAKIPEQAAAAVQVGSLARIKVPALGPTPFEARLVRFGVNADRDAAAVEGIFQLNNSDGRLRPGMRAEFAVILEQRTNVLAVPREAIQGDPANRTVFIQDFDLPDAFLRQPVITGQRNDQFVEIISGLFAGDQVVTQGSYPLGFVGSGAGISLKEALDAAHGHEHNEDGSEITADQKKSAAKKAKQLAQGGAQPSSNNGWQLWYAALMTVLAVVLSQQLINRRRR